jgi:lipooligosaccharide transport system permease protein
VRITGYHITNAAWKVWRRNWDVFFKTYQVNFLPPFIEPILYLLAIGYGLGTFVGEIDGIPYVRYIAPALISISIMNAAFFECTYSSYVRMYYQKTFDAIIATPLSIDEVIAGELLWGATRSLIYASLMLIVLFTAVVPGIDALNYPSFLFITPMFLFSGTFFPLSVLPEPLQVFALAVLPLTQLVVVSRALTLSSYSYLVLYSLAWIAVVGIFFFFLAIRLMRRRLIV